MNEKMKNILIKILIKFKIIEKINNNPIKKTHMENLKYLFIEKNRLLSDVRECGKFMGGQFNNQCSNKKCILNFTENNTDDGDSMDYCFLVKRIQYKVIYPKLTGKKCYVKFRPNNFMYLFNLKNKGLTTKECYQKAILKLNDMELLK